MDIESEAYGGLPPYVQGSETSREAAYAIKMSVASLRADVLRFFVARGLPGATDEEVQLGLPLDPNTERPRRIELQRAGYLSKSQRKRRTRAGRWAAVYVPTQTGVTWVRVSREQQSLPS
jgi:hypothetical protein